MLLGLRQAQRRPTMALWGPRAWVWLGWRGTALRKHYSAAARNSGGANVDAHGSVNVLRRGVGGGIGCVPVRVTHLAMSTGAVGRLHYQTAPVQAPQLAQGLRRVVQVEIGVGGVMCSPSRLRSARRAHDCVGTQAGCAPARWACTKGHAGVAAGISDPGGAGRKETTLM